MQRWQSFIGLTLLGGLGVVLPIAIFILVLNWLFGLAAKVASPLSSGLVYWGSLGSTTADIISVLAILGACFAIGLLVKTQLGALLHKKIDTSLARLAPGYKTIREVVSQVLGGDGKSSILQGEVCRAWILGRSFPTSVTGIITAKHTDGGYTVYVPTAPLPSSGLVYHLPSDCVEILPNIGVEDALRTVIACGAGSQIITDTSNSQPPVNMG